VSVVIFLGLVVLWAAVLIPMWLRRHDEAEESRSIDRFTSAMHTLSRKEPADKRYVVMPHRSRSVEVHVSGASAQGRRRGLRRLTARRTASRRPITAATRRRRTLIGLLAVTVVTLAAAMYLGGSRLWVPQFVVDVLFVAFVANLVLNGRRAAPVRSTRAAPAARRRPVPVARPARMVAPAEAVEPALVRAAPARRESLFDQVSAPAAMDLEWTLSDPLFDQTAELDLAGAERVAAAQTAQAEPVVIDLSSYEETIAAEPELEIGGRPWEPVPVPRPTYTTKPTAPARTPRAPIFEPLLPPVETAAEADPADDLEEILDRRWAVND
jgi:hypothetical protein